MGCDIHLVVERRVSGKWERVESLPPRACSWCDGVGHYKNRPGDQCYSCKGSGAETGAYGDRNYIVFSVLANVRNEGYVKPISESRGLPEDATHATGVDEDGLDRGAYEHGDHSFSWLTLAELLAHDWKQECRDEGWVDAENFKAWDEAGATGGPKEWCKGVGGGRVQHVTHSEMRRRLTNPYPWEQGDSAYTLIQWTFTLADRCRHFLSFVETLRGLGDPVDVRIVFGFDS